MDHNRAFTRPLLVQVTDHSAAFVAILCDRAEDQPDLAGHLLAALDDLRSAFDLDREGMAEPVYTAK